MIAAAEKAGLEIVKVRTISSSAWWIYISSKIIRNQGRIPGGTLAKSDLSVTNIFRGLNFLIWERSQGLIRFKSMHNSGEELLLIARKPSKEQHD